jgi:hypothetical protein
MRESFSLELVLSSLVSKGVEIYFTECQRIHKYHRVERQRLGPKV